jgi:hypothetical protein
VTASPFFTENSGLNEAFAPRSRARSLVQFFLLILDFRPILQAWPRSQVLDFIGFNILHQQYVLPLRRAGCKGHNQLYVPWFYPVR